MACSPFTEKEDNIYSSQELEYKNQTSGFSKSESKHVLVSMSEYVHKVFAGHWVRRRVIPRLNALRLLTLRISERQRFIEIGWLILKIKKGEGCS